MLGNAPPSKRLYLVGAGISIDEPSGVTGVPELLDAIFTKTQVRGGPSKDAYWRAASVAPQHNPFGALRFEAVLQAFMEVAPQMRDVLPRIAHEGAPNYGHHFLASELAQGATVLTTNFDQRIERACELQEVACKPFVLSKRHAAPTENDRLIKLHGTFGGRVSPRATLLAIGRLGLGFSSFPTFRAWLKQRGDECDFIVLGYSASDHFDVVPLIEETIRPTRVFWMDYAREAAKVRRKPCKACLDPSIPPKQGLEFPSVLMGALANRKADVQMWRVEANSLEAFIAKLAPGYVPPIHAPAAAEANTYASNLKALKARLSKLKLGAYERREFAKMLLEEDPYGGYLGVDFEKGSAAKSADLGDGLFDAAKGDVARYGLEGAKQRLAKIDTRKMSPNQYGDHVAKRFFFETEGEDDAATFEAAKDLVKAEVARGAYDAFRANELLLMMVEDVFDEASLRRNIKVMAAITRYVRAMFRSTGLLGAGVQALLMEARTCHRTILKGATKARRKALIEKGLESARGALYFAIRAARDDLIEQALWLSAYFHECVGDRDEGLRLLERYIDWIPEEAVETKGVTLTNLTLLSARQGKIDAAKTHLRRLGKITTIAWPARPLFAAVARAQICALEGDHRKARASIKRARDLIVALSPTDPWRHREELQLLEDQLNAEAAA